MWQGMLDNLPKDEKETRVNRNVVPEKNTESFMDETSKHRSSLKENSNKTNTCGGHS